MKDYSKEPLEIYQTTEFEVFDPWDAAILGKFRTRELAELFIDALMAVQK